MVKRKNLQRRNRYTSGCEPLQEMWDRYKKKERDNFCRKRRSTVFIYLPGSKFREDEGHLMMSSYLRCVVFNSAPRIGKTETNWNCTDSALL